MEYHWELRRKNAQNIKAPICPLYWHKKSILKEETWFRHKTHLFIFWKFPCNFSQTTVVFTLIQQTTFSWKKEESTDTKLVIV